MRVLLSVLFFILCGTAAQARDAKPPEIRHVQSDSTDVFEVLTRLKHAETALDQREYSAARHGFESVLMHDPSLVAARTGLRRVLIATGDIEAAQEFMVDATSPDSVIIRVRLGQVDDPKTLIRRVLKTDSDPRLWNLLGQIQDKDRQFAPARQSYAMGGLAGARAGLPMNNIGHSHWLAGEYELALEAFSKAVSLDPLDTQFDALIRLGQTQAAIAGLDAERAAHFLAQAADKATAENEVKLARYLYKKSLDLAPRHNPLTAEKLARLKY